MNIKKHALSFWGFIKSGLDRLLQDTISFKVWHLILLIIAIFGSVKLYNWCLDLSLYMTELIPIKYHDSTLVIFVVYFTPFLIVSYVLSKFFYQVSFRAFRYLFLSMGIFVELFINKEPGFFTNYIYFFFAVDTLFYLVSKKTIEREG